MPAPIENVPVDEVSFTELIQHPTRTTQRLNTARALRLRRRDADDLVLMSATRAGEEGQVIDLTARLLAGVLRELGSPAAIRQAVLKVLPWTRWLPSDALDELVAEFVDTTRAAADLRNTAPIAQLLAEWRHTAEVYADPELHTSLSRAHEGDHGRVPQPEAAA